ncbi:MAG: molybdate ABC transporter substrate-binding protein [Burkholderiales bacterium]|nr:molybdate ABC transporter substrate-binding protein [Burkholderiales bacterium]
MKKTLFVLLAFASIGAFLPQKTIAQQAAPNAPQPAPPLIAASSDLQQVFPALVRLFEQRNGGKVRVQFGAPGDVYQQIAAGASVELFLAGDETWAQRIVDENRSLKASKPYAVANLAFYVPPDSPLKADAMLNDIRGALRENRLRHLAIADPKDSPYGRLAERTLRRKLVLDDMQDKLMFADNVMEVLELTKDPAVQGGLISYAQARKSVYENGGRAVLLSDMISEPLIQYMVLLKGASNTAQMFFDFMQTREAKKTLLDYGFKLPNGETAAMLGY